MASIIFSREKLYSRATSSYNFSSRSTASIRGWLVFKGGFYLRKSGIYKST